jgi:hypothetical protein
MAGGGVVLSRVKTVGLMDLQTGLWRQDPWQDMELAS